MGEVVLVESRGPVRLLAMKRPAKLNARNADLVHALADALERARDIAVMMGRLPL